MRTWSPRLRRALLLVLAGLPLTVWLTVWLFARFEGRSLSWYDALLFLAETVTTVGYGELLPFRSPVTVLFSLTLMGLGFFGLFIYLTTRAGDWLASRFQELPPTSSPAVLREHVVICGYTPPVEALLLELQEHGQPFVLLDPSPEHVLRLRRAGVQAVLADPATAGGLAAGNLRVARALVADLDDSQNATILLQARHLRADLLLVATVEHREHESFLRYAGATEVLSPKEVIGRRIARWVSTPVPEGLTHIRTGQIPGLALRHLFVAPDSPLAGSTLRHTRLREDFGVSVVAIWRRGRVLLVPGPDEPLIAGTVITVVGVPAALDRLQALWGMKRRIRFGGAAGEGVGGGAGGESQAPGGEERASSICVVAGFGDVGAGCVRALSGAPFDMRVIGLTAPADAGLTFVQGDATDEAVLRRAGLPEAATFVVALNDDTAAIFATLMARHINPEVRIVARANHLQNVAGLYMAGADYVLSVPEVAGAALARILLRGTSVLTEAPDATLSQAPVTAALAGRTLARAAIGSRTGCMVVAVRRGEELYPTPGADFELNLGDELVLFGTPERLNRFEAALL